MMITSLRATPIMRRYFLTGSRAIANRGLMTSTLLRTSTNLPDIGMDSQLILKPKSSSIEPVVAKFVDVASSETLQVGAMLPFAKLNFFQLIVFPYTYAAMYYMDFMLNYLPWWQAIVVTTATARLLFFPLVVKQNIIGIKTHNILPQTQKFQLQMNEALACGDAYNQAMAKTKLHILYKEHGLSMKDRLVPILIQAPMYASIFFLLKGLASAPAEGLATGGAFWFTNLTIPDPYFILPVMTCSSLYLLFEFGMEGSVDPKSQSPIGRYIIRSLPLIMFVFIQNFPAATLLFWSTSNLFTLGYALLLKNTWMKTKFNIPARLKHDLKSLPLANKSFTTQFKETLEKGKARRTSIDVRRLDDISFRKAGVGPLRKTYKEPPKGA